MNIMTELGKMNKEGEKKPLVNNGSIVDSLNELTVAYGGTPSISGNIASALTNLRMAVADELSGENEAAPGVKFIDYDGTVVKSATKEEVMAMTALPKNPTHSGLTAQGWNWSLADIKTYLTNHPKAVMTVGQMYITDDGKTRVYINIGPNDLLSLPIMFQQSVSEGVTVNWGDGSEEETFEGTGVITGSHYYDEDGDYMITFEVTDDECVLDFGGGTEVTGSVFGTGYQAWMSAITAIEVGKNVTSLGINAFYGLVNTNHITIPREVKSLGQYTLRFPMKLKALVLPSEITEIPECLTNQCLNLEYLSIPSKVTSIGDEAFDTCRALKSLAIPDSVETIGANAFLYCNDLVSLTLPNSLTSTGTAVFSHCNRLVSLEIPGTYIVINHGMFYNCVSLSSLTIGEGVTTIQNNAFFGCASLTSLIIPETVTTIGEGAFSGCSKLEALVIPDSVTTIGKQAFDGSDSIRSLEVGEGLTTVGISVFGVLQSLEELTIPENMTTSVYEPIISSGGSCYLKELIVPEGVTTLSTPMGMPAMTELTLPSTLTALNGGCFRICPSLRTITVNATTPPTISQYVFASLSEDYTIYVPTNSVTTYKAATNWSKFADHITAIDAG